MPRRKPPPAPDLLSVLADERRIKLLAKGFFQVPDPHGGLPRWREPTTGAVLSEDEAFFRLADEPENKGNKLP